MRDFGQELRLTSEPINAHSSPTNDVALYLLAEGRTRPANETGLLPYFTHQTNPFGGWGHEKAAGFWALVGGLLVHSSDEDFGREVRLTSGPINSHSSPTNDVALYLLAEGRTRLASETGLLPYSLIRRILLVVGVMRRPRGFGCWWGACWIIRQMRVLGRNFALLTNNFLRE